MRAGVWRGFLRRGEYWWPLDREVTLVGRDPACGVQLRDDEASRWHALVLSYEGDFFILDFKSANGVLVNDESIDIKKLVSGDTIACGSDSFTFERLGSEGEDGLKKDTTRSRRLVDFSLELYEAPDEVTLPQVALKAALTALGAERALFATADGGSVEVVCEETRGLAGADDTAEDAADTNLRMSLLNEVIETGEPLFVGDAQKGFFGTDGVVVESAIGAVLCAPLFCDDDLVAVMMAETRAVSPRPLTAEDYRFFEAMAEHTALALRRLRTTATLLEAVGGPED